MGLYPARSSGGWDSGSRGSLGALENEEDTITFSYSYATLTPQSPTKKGSIPAERPVTLQQKPAGGGMQFNPGSGWQEAVTSVRDLDKWIEDLDYIAGWSLAHRGAMDSRMLRAWHLPADAEAEEAVVICREDSARWLRLVSFKGVAQTQIRSSGQPWETGGLFSILLYSANTQAAFQRAQERWWSAHHDPVVMEFGGRELLNVVLRGPDGCNFGLYQPLKPTPAEPFPFLKAGPPFNGQQMVRNKEQTECFYADALGWNSWFSGTISLSCNNFGIPDNMVGVNPKHVAIAHATEGEYGQVELVQWTGFEGQHYGDKAVPPNLGHLALRWPVDDLVNQVATIRAAGIDLFVEPTTVTLPPLGEVLLCTIRTPDGVMIELIQTSG